MLSKEPGKKRPPFSLCAYASMFLPSSRDAILISGIWIFFLAFGYFQEAVYHTHDPVTEERFRFPVFLVAVLCIGNVLVSSIILEWEHWRACREERTQHHVPLAQMAVFPTDVVPTGTSPDVPQAEGAELQSPTLARNPHQRKDTTLPSEAPTNHATSSTSCNSKDMKPVTNSECAWLPFLLRPLQHNAFLNRTLFIIQPWVLRQIALSSVTYILSMLCTNYSLSHVNYPTQVLVKSAKTVPVVLGGVLFFRRRYPLYDYITVGVITSALVGFNFLAPPQKKAIASIAAAAVKTPGHGAPQQTLLGIALLCLSLLCDALTGPRQDQLLSRVRISSTHLMFLTNIFATALGSVAFLLLEGAGPILFCIRAPQVIPQLFLFCLSAGLGQLFIFASLTAFGSLHLTLITTMRKFFTVLLSVMLFGHPVSPLQWLCVVAIFIALAVQSRYRHLAKRSAQPLQCASGRSKTA